MKHLEIHPQPPSHQKLDPIQDEFKQRPFPKEQKSAPKTKKPSPFELATKLSQKKRPLESTDAGQGPAIFLKTETFPPDESPVLGSVEGLDAQIETLCDQIQAGFEIMAHKGILKTRVVLHPPNPLSIFNGTEIELTQYDTSPLSLNIEFFGSESANLLLVSSVVAFEKSLKENLKETKIERIDFSLRSKSHQHKKVTQTDEF